MVIEYSEKGYKLLRFKGYKVVQESENYFAIYDNDENLITHKNKWRKATQLAQLLSNAYCNGYDDAMENYEDDYYYDD